MQRVGFGKKVTHIKRRCFDTHSIWRCLEYSTEYWRCAKNSAFIERVPELVLWFATKRSKRTNTPPTQQLTVTMLIFIKTKAGATLSIDIEDTATIRDLKARIHERQDIPAVHQTLVYAGRPLEDSKSLPECGIKKESTLHLLVKVPEVAPPPPMESKSKKSVIPMSHSKSAIGSGKVLLCSNYSTSQYH